MTTTTIPTWFKLNEERLVQDLLTACERLDPANDKITLDFSRVRRIDPAALKAVETLADKAEQMGVKVELSGVNVGIYKVLKLARLTTRASFAG
jgi:ABC-type transporter Mla MlaB component